MVWPDVLIGQAGGEGHTGSFKAKEIPGGQRGSELEPADVWGRAAGGHFGPAVSFPSQHFLACTTSSVDPLPLGRTRGPSQLRLDFWCPGMALGALLEAQMVKNLLEMQETQV